MYARQLQRVLLTRWQFNSTSVEDEFYVTTAVVAMLNDDLLRQQLIIYNVILLLFNYKMLLFS